MCTADGEQKNIAACLWFDTAGGELNDTAASEQCDTADEEQKYIHLLLMNLELTKVIISQ